MRDSHCANGESLKNFDTQVSALLEAYWQKQNVLFSLIETESVIV